ncbi:MAG: carboxypeptidase regulatory-like domain-containing protein [Bradymonadia bacterium]
MHRWITYALGLWLGCGAGLAHGETRAITLEHPEQLLKGPEASGKLGDFKISNAHLQAVITAQRPDGRGGRLVDFVPTGGADGLGEMGPAFDPAGRRQPLIQSVKVTQAGGQGAAIIQATGVDALDEEVKISINYVLEPDSTYLKIITTVHHRGRSHYQDFALGRFILWGDLTPFAPGVGADPVGRRARSPWIGASSPSAAMVLAPYDGLIESFHGRGWTVTRETEPYLRPGSTLTLESWLWAEATGGVAGPVAQLNTRRKSVVGQIEGRVFDAQGPVAGARVTFIDGTRAPAHQARTNAEGRYTVTLSPGRYSAVALAPGRSEASTRWFRVQADQRASLDVELGGQGQVEVRISDEAGQLRPGRVRLIPKGKAPLALHAGDAPQIVDGTTAQDDQLYLSTGAGVWPVAPGQYTAVISAGPTASVERVPLTVKAGEVAQLRATLKTVMVPGAWRALDLRVHTRETVASAISPDIRALTCAVEGVDVIFADGPAGEIESPMMMTSLRTPADQWGWFGALPLAAPLSADDVKSTRRPRPAGRLEALKGLPGGPLVAVFDPRNPRTGYFEHFAFDPAAEALPRGGFTLNFDLIEIASGTLQRRLDAAGADVHGLLARGQRVRPFATSGITGLGASPCAMPRTWIKIPEGAELTPDAVLLGLSKGPMVASFGPIIDADMDTERLKVRVLAPSWHRPDTLTVRIDGKPWKSLKLKRRKGPLDVEKTISLKGATGRWLTVEVDGRPAAEQVYDIKVRPFALTAPMAMGAAR